jgi:hypothetical protein
VTRDDLRGRVIVEKNSTNNNSVEKPAEPAKAKEAKRKAESCDPEDGPPQLLYSGDSDSGTGSDDDSDESSSDDDQGRPPISDPVRRGAEPQRGPAGADVQSFEAARLREEKRQREKEAAREKRRLAAEAARERERQYRAAINPALTPQMAEELAAAKRAAEQEQEEQRKRLGLSAREPSSQKAAAQLLFLPGALTPTLCALSRVVVDGKPCCSSREPLHVSEYAEFMCSAGCVVYFHPICARGYTRLCEEQTGDKLKFGLGMRCLTDIACLGACPTGKGVSYLRCGDVREKHFLDKDWKDRRNAEKDAAKKARAEHREREKQKQMERNAQKKQKKMAAEAEGGGEAAAAGSAVAPPAPARAVSPNAPAPEPGSDAVPLSVKMQEILAKLRSDDPERADAIMALPRKEQRKELAKLLPKEQAPAVRSEDHARLVQRDNPVLVIQPQPKPTPEELEAEVCRGLHVVACEPPTHRSPLTPRMLHLSSRLRPPNAGPRRRRRVPQR